MNQHLLSVMPNELRQTASTLTQKGLQFLTMVVSDERRLSIGGFVIRYVFGSKANRDITILESVVPESNPRFQSVTPLLPAVSWYEREAHEMFGVFPDEHPDLRPLVLHEHWPKGVYPLRRDYPLEQTEPRVLDATWSYPKVEGQGVYEVPVGPIHASVIEPGHFRFHVMGDNVLHLEAKVFFTHRGIEKKSEGLHVENGLKLAQNLCGVCSVSNVLSYVQAVEQIASATIPLRALYLRSLLAELERLYNHVSDLGNICGGIGFIYGTNEGSRLKERLLQMNETLTGHRYLRGMITLGGVASDFTHSQLNKVLETITGVQTELREIVDVILSHDIVQARFRKVGTLPYDLAQAFGAVGPAGRASGLHLDTRRDFPYAAYSRLTFQSPVLQAGDVLARYKMRFLEAEQTFSMIQQIITQLPDGPIVAPIGELHPFTFGLGITESPRGENVHFVMSGENNTIFRYRIRSAAYANWPVVPLCAPDNSIADFPLINKSFELCYACCDR
jgi:Ni,Fe-hydrogenase III large subunit/Ni,Fe-hydrogenase III component G